MFRQPHPTSTPALRRARGFSMIEIMVAVVIGLLASIVILQVYSLSEARNRTASAGGDAQSSGIIVYYQLLRDFQQAAYGMSATRLLNCNTVWAVSSSGATIATAVPVAPVTINPNVNIIPQGDAHTDTILVMYGSTDGQPQGMDVDAAAGNVYTMKVAGGFNVGDHVIAAPTSCSAANLQMDSVTAVTGKLVTTANAALGSSALYNLGASPTILAYAVRSGNLTVCDYLVNDCGLDSNKGNPSVWVPIADNISSLRARYGRDTTATADGVPDVYDQVQPTTACGWARIAAVQFALVARAAQYEKDVVTTTAPDWMGSTDDIPTVGSIGAPFDLSTDTYWQQYRYKTYEGVAPIRNITWMGATGC